MHEWQVALKWYVTVHTSLEDDLAIRNKYKSIIYFS